MFGTSSCNFRIRSLIFVLLTWEQVSAHQPTAQLQTRKLKKIYTRMVFTNPLSNTAWVCGTSPLGTDFARHSILELEEFLNICHL
jgi:hypothetical protein